MTLKARFRGDEDIPPFEVNRACISFLRNVALVVAYRSLQTQRSNLKWEESGLERECETPQPVFHIVSVTRVVLYFHRTFPNTIGWHLDREVHAYESP